MKPIYVIEILRGKKWEPTGPNWWFTKAEAEQARRAFRDMHIDQKYRIGRYRSA